MDLLNLAEKLGLLTREEATRVGRELLPGEEEADALRRLGLLSTEQLDRLRQSAVQMDDASTLAPAPARNPREPEPPPSGASLGISILGRPDSGGWWAGGRYQIERTLGEGAMGVAYLALRKGAGEGPVVLKLMKRPTGPDPAAFVERFRREIYALRQLEHPRIARLLDSGTEGHGSARVPWYALEYHRGDSLEQWVAKQEGRIPLSWAVNTVARLAGACGHAHQRGFIHRDVKPANILVEPGGCDVCLILYQMLTGVPALDRSMGGL